MDIKDRVAVVTGGGSGIGAALCRALMREGAKGVVVVDINEAGAAAVAGEFGSMGLAIAADVSDSGDVRNVVEKTVSAFGRIDIFASNAGTTIGGGMESPVSSWQRAWEVNALAHVFAAQEALPLMIEQGGGYLVQTLSAGALLSAPHNGPYAVSKAAALGFAQWLAVTYREQGIRVSCLCPQAVRTPMYAASGENADKELLAPTLVEPEAVADAAIAAMRDERFLVFSDDFVEKYTKRRWENIDDWTAKMARFQAKGGPPSWPPRRTA